MTTRTRRIALTVAAVTVAGACSRGGSNPQPDQDRVIPDPGTTTTAIAESSDITMGIACGPDVDLSQVQIGADGQITFPNAAVSVTVDSHDQATLIANGEQDVIVRSSNGESITLTGEVDQPIELRADVIPAGTGSVDSALYSFWTGDGDYLSTTLSTGGLDPSSQQTAMLTTYGVPVAAEIYGEAADATEPDSFAFSSGTGSVGEPIVVDGSPSQAATLEAPLGINRPGEAVVAQVQTPAQGNGNTRCVGAIALS